MRLKLLRIFERFAHAPGTAYHHVDGDLSYAALHGRAGALSQHLSTQDAERSAVIIWGHKHRSYHVAYWACLLSGRALIPVEPDTPPERLLRIAQTCGAGMVLNTEEDPLPTDLPGLEVMQIRDFELEGPAVEVTCHASDTAYIMYSSGSSGTPKGIKVTYANLAHFVDWLRDDLFPGNSFKAVSGTVRHCFDVSLFEIWTAWINLLPISALDHREFINSRKYIDRYSSHGVGLWVSTPSTIQTYLKDRAFRAESLPALSTFLFCGEVLGKQTVKTLMVRFPKARIINTYGPTEATVAVTSIDITQRHIEDTCPLPIGYTRPGCALSLVEGQIVISGPSVGAGYVALPKKTAAAFPTADSYLTGDAAKVDASGLWSFGGRIDRELKVQGLRVDPSEIEDDLMRLPEVQTAFVEPHMIRGEVRALRAYVYGPEDPASLEDIAAGIASRLPPAMVPRFWHLCSSLQHNQNSKIDKEKTMALAHDAHEAYVFAPDKTPLPKSPPHVDISVQMLDGLGFLRIAENAVRKNGPIVTLMMPRGGRALTLLAAPEHAKFWSENEHLFTKDHKNKSSGAAAMRAVLGETLQTSADGEAWKDMRREMTRLLGTAKPWFQRPLRQATLRLIDDLQEDEPRPLMELCLKWATRSICDPLFRNPELEAEACKMLETLDQNFFERMAAMPPSESTDEITGIIQNITRKIADEAGAETILQAIMSGDTYAGTKDEKLRRIVAGLLAASLHMNGMTLFWALMHLSDHPNLQHAIAREAAPLGTQPRRVAETPGAFVALRETLRMKPVTAFIERQVTAPFVLDGISFEPGQSVLFSPLMVHMNPNCWDEPTRFDPSRFLEGGSPDKAHYLPFGIGKRVCVGVPVVNQQLTYAISVICNALCFEHAPETRPGDLKHMFKIVLEPRGAVRLAAKPRVRVLQEG